MVRSCPQLPYPPPWRLLLPELVGTGEDCLTLNVWSSCLGSARQPVMVEFLRCPRKTAELCRKSEVPFEILAWTATYCADSRPAPQTSSNLSFRFGSATTPVSGFVRPNCARATRDIAGIHGRSSGHECDRFQPAASLCRIFRCASSNPYFNWYCKPF